MYCLRPARTPQRPWQKALRIPAGNPGVRGLRQTAEFGTATGAETEGGDPRNEGTTDSGTPENLQINFPEILG